MNGIIIMCWEFFKAGLFAIGGGLMALPFFYDMAGRYDWFTEQDVADMIAISEATPGPFGINMATFAGFKAYGIVGSLLGVFFMILPCFVIIIIVSKFLEKFSENKWVKSAFKGLRPCVCALMVNAWLSIAKVSLVYFDALKAGDFMGFILPVNIGIFILIFVGTRIFKKASPVVWLIAGAVLGLIFL